MLTGIALDDFQARSSDELSLAKGDRVELLERDDEFGDGWFLGKHLANGLSGLFPEGMVNRGAMFRWLTWCSIHATRTEARSFDADLINTEEAP